MTQQIIRSAMNALNHYERLIATNPKEERKGATMLHPTAVPSASKLERQRRSIYKPWVARASGLPWDRTAHGRSTLKGLRLPITLCPHGTDATLSGLPGPARALTQGRRLRANPGLNDRTALGFTGGDAAPLLHSNLAVVRPRAVRSTQTLSRGWGLAPARSATSRA